MLHKRSNSVGEVFLFYDIVLLTYRYETREAKIPKAGLSIFCNASQCNLFLRDCFMFTKNKNEEMLLNRILQIGADNAFHYKTRCGFINTSVKQTEIEMENV